MDFHKKSIFSIIMVFFVFFSACSDKPKPINRSKKKEEIKKVKQAQDSKNLHKDTNYKKLKDSIKILDYKEAGNLLKILLKIYPKSAELYYLFAIITKNSNPDPLKAIEILHISTGFDDKYGDAWKLLGDLYYIRAKFNSSIKAWELAIETIKDDANLYYKLGYVYYTKKDYKLAVKYFQESLKLDNKLEWSYYYLGEINFEKFKKVDIAIDFIKKGLKVLPKSKNLNQKLAIFYYDSGKYQESIKWNKEVLKIIKYDNFAIENISDTYMKLKKYDKAIKWLDKILKEQPKSIYYIKKLANIYKLSNNLEKAIDLLSFAHNLKENPNVKKEIAELYLKLGNTKKYEETIKDLKLSKNPEATRVLEYLDMGKNNIQKKIKP